MLAFLLSGDGTVVAQVSSRAQLPLLLAQAQNLSTIAVDQAVETDTAQDVLVFMGAALVPVDQAAETDTAFDVVLAVGTPPDDLFVQVELATETDEAFDVTVFAPTALFIALDMAEETDEAFSVTARRSFMTPVFVNDSVMLTAFADTDDVTLTPVEVA